MKSVKKISWISNTSDDFCEFLKLTQQVKSKKKFKHKYNQKKKKNITYACKSGVIELIDIWM